MRKRLVEWRDSPVAVCVKGVTGVSPFFAYREREGQSAIDTDPGDTIKTLITRVARKTLWQIQFESDANTVTVSLS